MTYMISKRMKPPSLYYISLLVLLTVFTSKGLAVEKLYIDESVDTAYLPYIIVEERDLPLTNDGSFPVYNIVEVIKPAIKDKSDGVLIYMTNASPDSGDDSRFSVRRFPNFEVIDDDPIKYNITNWKLYIPGDPDKPFIVGICHDETSLYVFKLFVASDSVQYNKIYQNKDDPENKIKPFAFVFYVGDMNLDGKSEILIFIQVKDIFRRLYCFDFNSLEINWVRKDPSFVSPSSFCVYEHPKKSRFIFCTSNPANGYVDSSYNDYFSYFFIFNDQGNTIFNEILGHYGHRAPALIRSEKEDEFLVTHLINFNAPDTIIEDKRREYFLSRVDIDGNIIKQTIIDGIPLCLWILRTGDRGEQRIFVKLASKKILVYDLNLNLLFETEPLNISQSYHDTYKIAGEKDSVSVFIDGIYDRNLKKLAQFPFIAGSFQAVEYDTLGNLTSFVITKHNHSFIGSIQKKTIVELLTVFYHQNQNYVLVIMTGLLVSLTLMNYYRSKTKHNLKTIASQKKELEKTHEALKKAQATIVAQEKFQQAKNIAGGFAHEIRNALSPARNAIYKLLSTPEIPKEKMLSLAKFSDKAVERAINITRLISNYTRLDAQREAEAVNINNVINEILKSNAIGLKGKNITVSYNDPEPAIVAGNREQFYMVFNNLLLNAIDALSNENNPTVSFHQKTENDTVSINITDNGCGIDTDSLNKIFDVFYSTKPSTGTGLGLSMVKKIIEMYNGGINVSSQPGKGTTFTITLKIYNGDKNPDE